MIDPILDRPVAFAATPADGPAAFDRESDRHPVFLVEQSVEQSGLRPS